MGEGVKLGGDRRECRGGMVRVGEGGGVVVAGQGGLGRGGEGSGGQGGGARGGGGYWRRGGWMLGVLAVAGGRGDVGGGLRMMGGWGEVWMGMRVEYMLHDVILYHMISYDVYLSIAKKIDKRWSERGSNPAPMSYETDARPLHHSRFYKILLFQSYIDSCALNIT